MIFLSILARIGRSDMGLIFFQIFRIFFMNKTVRVHVAKIIVRVHVAKIIVRVHVAKIIVRVHVAKIIGGVRGYTIPTTRFIGIKSPY